MSDTAKLQLRYDALTKDFLAPLLMGGTVIVDQPIAPGAIHYFEHASASEANVNSDIFDHLHRGASAIAPITTVPWPDRDLLLLAMCAYDLVLMTDPELDRLFARGARTKVVRWVEEMIEAIAPPDTRADALARHALLDPVPALRRVDTVAESWAYKYRFVGRPTSASMFTRPLFGKFRETTNTTDVSALMAQIDDKSQLGLGRRLRELLSRSPVTELVRLDLCQDFRFGLATLAVLSDDAIRGGIARVIVERGEWIAAPRLGRALGDPLLHHAPPAHLYYALALCFEVQMTATLDVPGLALPQRLDLSDRDTARYAAVLPAFFEDETMIDEVRAFDERDRREVQERCDRLAAALPPGIREEVAPLVRRCQRPLQKTSEPESGGAPVSATSPQQTIQRLGQVARTLEGSFLGKSEAVRLMLVAAIAGEHMVLIGPPGTAKSAVIRLFAKLIDAKYFEYLLTRFTEPNEIFGPIDITAFREGQYSRRMEGMLPQAEIVFLDEVFKANSAILNSLLSVLNERVYTVGSHVHRTPLISAFGASNEVPNDEDLMAVFDRFLLRVRSDNLDSYHFQELLQRGLAHEVTKISGEYEKIQPLLNSKALHDLSIVFAQRMKQFPEDFLSTYKGLVFQIRAEGVSMSDRRAIKLLKLFAASAMLDGRHVPDASDFFILRHIWNNLDQAEILDGVVGPVLEAHYREHPEARRFGAADVGMDALVAEINRIRELLTGDRPLSDIQLFSQLKALNEIKAALAAIGTQPAQEAIARVDQLLGHVFQSGKFSQ